jgi:hypothetical protein
MRLGVDLRQQPGEDVEHARAHFLRIANELDKRPLADLHEAIYEKYLLGTDPAAEINDWCRRWHLVFQGEPAAWVVNRVQWTLPWWRRGKPNPMQLLTGQDGNQPIEPLEWYLSVGWVGIPTILREGETSPFEHTVTYELDRRRQETEKAWKERIMKEHRRQRASLEAAIAKAQAIRRNQLVETPNPSSFEDHVKWAVQFQVLGKEVRDILDSRHPDSRGTIDKGINSVLKFIQLTRRPPGRRGRPPKHPKSSG